MAQEHDQNKRPSSKIQPAPLSEFIKQVDQKNSGDVDSGIALNTLTGPSSKSATNAALADSKLDASTIAFLENRPKLAAEVFKNEAAFLKTNDARSAIFSIDPNLEKVEVGIPPVLTALKYYALQKLLQTRLGSKIITKIPSNHVGLTEDGKILRPGYHISFKDVLAQNLREHASFDLEVKINDKESLRLKIGYKLGTLKKDSTQDKKEEYSVSQRDVENRLQVKEPATWRKQAYTAVPGFEYTNGPEPVISDSVAEYVDLKAKRLFSSINNEAPPKSLAEFEEQKVVIAKLIVASLERDEIFKNRGCTLTHVFVDHETKFSKEEWNELVQASSKSGNSNRENS